MNDEYDIFDDFDLGPQSDEFIPDYLEDGDWENDWDDEDGE
jgi:hypothetical protein